MERVTTDQLHRTLVNNIHSAQRRVMDTQEQLSSGYRVNKPSDDPVRSTRVMSLLSQQAQIEQYKENMEQARSWTRASEDAITHTVDIIQRARTLLLQGANDSQSPSARSAMASEVSNLVDSIKLLANSKMGEEYLFSGTKSTTAPYTVSGPDAYAGDTGSIIRPVGPGETVTVGVSGISIFGDSSSGLIQTLRSIAANLTANTTASITSMRTTDLQNLDSALANLGSIRATIGEVESRLETQVMRLEDLSITNQELLSMARDTDVALASAEYAQRAAALQAALRTGQQVVMPSLVDFMN